MISIAVQGQQASQMVEIQGAPQPAAGSGETFLDTLAATVGGAPGTKTIADGTAQPGSATARSAFSNNSAVSNVDYGKTALESESTTGLASPTTVTTAPPISGEFPPEALVKPGVPSLDASSVPTNEGGAGAIPTSASPDPTASNAVAPPTISLPAPDDSVVLVPGTTLRRGAITPVPTGLTSSAAKATQSERKTDVPSSKGAASTLAQASVSQPTIATADLNPSPVVPVAVHTAAPLQFDLGTKHQAVEPQAPAVTSISVGSVLNGSLAQHSATGTSGSEVATSTPVASLAVNTASIAAAEAPSLYGSTATLPDTASPASIVSTANVSGLNSAAASTANAVASSSISAADSGAISGTFAARVAQSFADGASTPSKDSSATAEASQFVASIKTQPTSPQTTPTSLPVGGTVPERVQFQSPKSAFAAQAVSTTRSNAASVPSTKSATSTARPGAAGLRQPTSDVGTSNASPIEANTGSATVVAPVQAPIAPLELQPTAAPRETAAAVAPIAKDGKIKPANSGATQDRGSTAASSQTSDSVTQGISVSDSTAGQRDAAVASQGGVVAVAVPVAHGAVDAVASAVSHASGVSASAISSVGSVAGTRSVGAFGGTSVGGPSAPQSTVRQETGAGTALDSGIATDGAPSHRTLIANPTTLEVGVPNGTQGWLRIRAEVGGQGEVNASLSAASSGAQATLHSQLPALNAYLHSEQMPVTATVAERTFASFTGAGTGAAADHAASGGSSNPNGSGGSFLQGGAPQSNADQRQSPQSTESSSDLLRGYAAVPGVSEVAAAAAAGLQSGQVLALSAESGQWLNVRV